MKRRDIKDLSVKEQKLLRRALCHAMDERDSLADAYHREGKVAEAAMQEVRDIEMLHVKLFGEQSARRAEMMRMKSMKTRSIFDLLKEKDNGPE